MLDKKSIQLYRRLLRYIYPYKTAIATALVMIVIIATMEPMAAAILGQLIDKSLIEKDPSTFMLLPALLAAVFVVKGIAEYFSTVLSTWIAEKAILNIRGDLYRKILHLPQTDYNETSTGILMSKITYDVQQTGTALSEAWIIIIRDSLIILALLATLIYYSWQLTLVMLVVGPIVAFFIDQASKLMRASSTNMQQDMGTLTHRLEEGIKGIRDVKIYGAENYEQNRFHEAAESLRQNTMKVVKVSALNVPLVQVLAAIALSIVVYIAIQMVNKGEMSPGDLITYVTAMGLIFEPIRRITNINQTIQKGLAAAESIFAMLDKGNEPNPGSRALTNFKGGIQFKNVDFSYPNSNSSALTNFNLSIPAHKTTALVGESGSGKTTIANLTAQFYRPCAGSIHFDKMDTQDIELNNLREQIAYVGQDIVLFNDTLAANIAYGQTQYNTKEIQAAAESAHAWDFISALPEGLDTIIGDNGTLLSGGQRQRIAIARAFLKNAPILIMDEATSALDNQSEHKIQLAIQALQKDKTVLIIAHRLSTIEKSDNIIVMQQGQVLEQGAHVSLLALKGAYYQLYNQHTQSGTIPNHE